MGLRRIDQQQTNLTINIEEKYVGIGQPISAAKRIATFLIQKYVEIP